MLKELWIIYKLFFSIGAVTFGGGYAMLPILRREIMENRHWTDEETVMDYYALSQSLPGIIAVNVSVFIGYRRKGVPGAIAGALGIVSPCIVVISIIYYYLSNFQDNLYVQRALAGVSVCVAALILDAVINMWKKGVKDRTGIVICLVMLVLNTVTDLSPILLIISCALVGILIQTLRIRKSAGGNAQ